MLPLLLAADAVGRRAHPSDADDESYRCSGQQHDHGCDERMKRDAGDECRNERERNSSTFGLTGHELERAIHMPSGGATEFGRAVAASMSDVTASSPR